MEESILLDSIDFGINTSERLHPAGGSFAKKQPVLQAQYAGPSFHSDNDYVLFNWRDWADEISVDLTVPEEFRDRPLQLSIIIRPYIHGEPSAPLQPMTLRVESDQGVIDQDEADVQFNLDGLWIVVEKDYPAGKIGPSGLFRLILDNRVNMFPDGSHFGKSIASVRLFAQLTETGSAS